MIKKPYAAVNAYTGAVVKRFKSVKKLVKYLFKAEKTAVGNMRPYDFGVVPCLITGESDAGVDVAPIEFVR